MGADSRAEVGRSYAARATWRASLDTADPTLVALPPPVAARGGGIALHGGDRDGLERPHRPHHRPHRRPRRRRPRTSPNWRHIYIMPCRKRQKRVSARCATRKWSGVRFAESRGKDELIAEILETRELLVGHACGHLFTLVSTYHAYSTTRGIYRAYIANVIPSRCTYIMRLYNVEIELTEFVTFVYS